MIHTTTAETLSIATEAALSCGMVLDTTGERRWDYAPFLRDGEADPTPAGPQIGVFRLPADVNLGFNRPPAVVGVFGQGPYTLVWDDFREGWGLTSRIGYEGRHFKAAIVMETVRQFAEAAGLDRKVIAERETIKIRLWRKGADMTQNPIITIEIDEKGNVTIEVDGMKGSGCSLLTKDIEQALGKVVDTERKSEYNAPTQQTVKIGQS
jgi:hypothetical protein